MVEGSPVVDVLLLWRQMSVVLVMVIGSYEIHSLEVLPVQVSDKGLLL